MSPEDYHDFILESVHLLMDQNRQLDQTLRLSTWPRWDYDLRSGTLVFSENGEPRVYASIETVGAFSTTTERWRWAWADDRIPEVVKRQLEEVRTYGQTHRIEELIEAELPADERRGWELTAVAARLLGALGAYRCPVKDEFLFVLFTALRRAEERH